MTVYLPMIWFDMNLGVSPTYTPLIEILAFAGVEEMTKDPYIGVGLSIVIVLPLSRLVMSNGI